MVLASLASYGSATNMTRMRRVSSAANASQTGDHMHQAESKRVNMGLVEGLTEFLPVSSWRSASRRRSCWGRFCTESSRAIFFPP